MRSLKGLPLLTLLVLALYSAPARAQTDVRPEPDLSWQTNGRVYAVTFSSGVMYIGGAFTSVRPPGAPVGTDEVVRNHVAAIDADTGELLPWNPDVDGNVYSIYVHKGSPSTVFLGGGFTSVRGSARNNLAAVSGTSVEDTTDTAVLLEWDPGADKVVRTIAKGPNGNLFIGGHFNTIGGVNRPKIAQLTMDGFVVAEWAPTIGQLSGYLCPPRCLPKVFTIAFGPSLDAVGDPVTAVFFGGHFGLVNGVSREQAAAVDIDDSSNVLPFNPNIYADEPCPGCTIVETHRLYNMVVYDSKIYMCGGFWTTHAGFGGTRQKAFNLLVTDMVNGWKDPTFAAGNDGDTPDCAILDGILYFGGHFSYVGAICSQNPPPGTDTRKCRATNSTHRIHVAAVDATTGEVLDWDPGENSRNGVWSVGRDGSHVGFGGDFTEFAGVPQQGIALYSENLPSVG